MPVLSLACSIAWRQLDLSRLYTYGSGIHRSTGKHHAEGFTVHRYFIDPRRRRDPPLHWQTPRRGLHRSRTYDIQHTTHNIQDILHCSRVLCESLATGYDVSPATGRRRASLGATPRVLGSPPGNQLRRLPRHGQTKSLFGSYPAT